MQVQKAGQIEPNWQHDLRNLQHGLKRNGTVINPSFEVWGLPINVVETNQLERAWRKACDIGGVPGASSTIKASNGVVISRNLFFERFGHLLRCGGLLPRGALHRWTAHESALLMLLDPYVEAGDWISLRVEQSSHPSGLTLLEVFEQQSRVEEAMHHGENHTLARVNEGRHRRTEVRRASRVDGGKGGALPNPKDRNGKIVPLRDANQTNLDQTFTATPASTAVALFTPSNRRKLLTIGSILQAAVISTIPTMIAPITAATAERLMMPLTKPAGCEFRRRWG